MVHLSCFTLTPLTLLLSLAQEAWTGGHVSGALAEERGASVVQSEDTLVPRVFEGFVLESEGAPAQGAVVVSSAGGKAVTDVSGSFRLAVSVPLAAESVQVTAVGQGVKSLTATASVSISAASGPLWVGPLLLTSGTCSPSWLPTFGGTPGTNYDIEALSVFDDGGGSALYAGGLFEVAYDSSDSYVAKWGHGPDTTPPALSCPEVVFAQDLGSPSEVVTFSVSSTDCQDPAPTLVCSPASGSFFPRGRTLVTCTATDASGNQSTSEFPVVVQVRPVRPR